MIAWGLRRDVVNGRTRGVVRGAIPLVGFVAVAALGCRVTVAVLECMVIEPPRAVPASSISGSKTRTPRRDAQRPVALSVESKTPMLPAGEARLVVPRRSQAITAFRVWLDASLSSFKEVEIEVTNVTEGHGVLFQFASQNEGDATIGNDHVSIVLDDDGRLHHMLTFDLHSDYMVAHGCPTSWGADVQQMIWSFRISGIPTGGRDRQAIPLQRVRVRSYDFGDPCPSNIMKHVRHCIEPDESVVVRPSPGEVRECTMAPSKIIESP